MDASIKKCFFYLKQVRFKKNSIYLGEDSN